MSTVPPVTFIVTGYNQSALIDAAIQGALTQDYPNLEIILTDDRSQDDTFAQMEAAARNYRGPHLVRALRPPVNLGTFGNIHYAFLQSRGELIVFAGGDDISYPDRTRTIVDAWRLTGADAFHSRYDVIDEHGILIERDWKPPADGLWLLDYFPSLAIDPLHGASMACTRGLLARHPPHGIRIRSEDAYITLMLALEGGSTSFIDRALVRYRRHPGAITNETQPAPTRAAVAARERVQMGFADSQRQLIDFFMQRRGHRGDAVEAVIADDRALFAIRARWEQSSFLERLKAFPAARRRGHLDWLLPRLSGFAPFVAAKAMALRRRS